MRTGNIAIQNAVISGHIGYVNSFSGHGYEVHAPFDNSDSRSDSAKNQRADGSSTTVSLSWTGTEVHPANGYDGPQGGGYPRPAGARDLYSFSIAGTASGQFLVSQADIQGRDVAPQYRTDLAGVLPGQAIAPGAVNPATGLLYAAYPDAVRLDVVSTYGSQALDGSYALAVIPGGALPNPWLEQPNYGYQDVAYLQVVGGAAALCFRTPLCASIPFLFGGAIAAPTGPYLNEEKGGSSGEKGSEKNDGGASADGQTSGGGSGSAGDWEPDNNDQKRGDNRNPKQDKTRNFLIKRLRRFRNRAKMFTNLRGIRMHRRMIYSRTRMEMSM